MPNQLQIAVGGLALAAAYQLGARRSRKKNFHLAYAYSVAMMANESLTEKCKYLAHIIDKNEIELSDFDVIVLTHDIEE